MYYQPRLSGASTAKARRELDFTPGDWSGQAFRNVSPSLPVKAAFCWIFAMTRPC